MKTKKKTLTKLKKELWVLVSQYVRMDAADDMGWVQCYTCPARRFWKNEPLKGTLGIQAGHCFTQGGHKSTIFDLDNIRPQCYQCNINNSGEGAVFRGNLERDHGKKFVNDLERRAKQPYRGDVFYLEDQIDVYKEKLKQLKLIKGL